jgi:hypothetical protein
MSLGYQTTQKQFMALFLDHLLPETATGWQAGNLNLAVCSRYGLEFSSSCHRGYCNM